MRSLFNYSRKPDELYDIIEQCSPSPYLELFARYPKAGWQVWGDEANADIVPRGKQHSLYRGGSISKNPNTISLFEQLVDSYQ